MLYLFWNRLISVFIKTWSPKTIFGFLQKLQAIRGGVPVCFPSFGPWEFGAQHGFARISKDWKVEKDIEVDPATGDAKVITRENSLCKI